MNLSSSKATQVLDKLLSAPLSFVLASLCVPTLPEANLAVVAARLDHMKPLTLAGALSLACCSIAALPIERLVTSMHPVSVAKAMEKMEIGPRCSMVSLMLWPGGADTNPTCTPEVSAVLNCVESTVMSATLAAMAEEDGTGNKVSQVLRCLNSSAAAQAVLQAPLEIRPFLAAQLLPSALSAALSAAGKQAGALLACVTPNRAVQALTHLGGDPLATTATFATLGADSAARIIETQLKMSTEDGLEFESKDKKSGVNVFDVLVKGIPPEQMSKIIVSMKPSAAAEMLQRTDVNLAGLALRSTPAEIAGQIVVHAEPKVNVALFSAMPTAAAAAILRYTEVKATAVTLASMDPKIAAEILQRLDPLNQQTAVLEAIGSGTSISMILRLMAVTLAAKAVEALSPGVSSAAMAAIDAKLGAQLAAHMSAAGASRMLDALTSVNAVKSAQLLTEWGQGGQYEGALACAIQGMGVELAANVLNAMKVPETAVGALQAMRLESAAAVLSTMLNLKLSTSVTILERIDKSALASILQSIDPSKAATVLRCMEVEKRSEVYKNINSESFTKELQSLTDS
eukprot:CAMPEP_0196591566 /NCGR_PEP_ID=MMETSP1081-20130531/70058_1 /TAXON_ID=36882 /ORGANISM="Pyramimonas amylifera, Strain CCMP720" /LENGTH=571 /DNA_ID=CAMNT_0041914961 /DNA_START=1 /DNA_END=1716 /DNA_ORIENTATION=+